MKNTCLAFKLAIFSLILISTQVTAAIDMQSHVASDAGKAAYTTYVTKQAAYYKTGYTYTELMAKTGTTLFGSLNELMGNTNKIAESRYSYGNLRSQYVYVDKDLNNAANFISYYNGASMDATWDSGSSWNREHTWPQSKFEGSETTNGTTIPIGYDMQSVRPASTSVNSDRGNTAYGEGSSYYDPNEISIDNTYYTTISNGSYRGDCARVILYDYITYGKNSTYYNTLYKPLCKTDLLTQIGSNSNSVFESLTILLKWHMQDPPSLTEMTRNDGGEVYQGNRNPFIDYPELAINMLKDVTNVTDYTVTKSTTASVVPNYQYTTPGGFVTYLTYSNGTHPAAVTVTGGSYQYDATLGRLTINSATGAVNISTSDDPSAINYSSIEDISYYAQNGVVYVSNLAPESSVSIFDCSGRLITKQVDCSNETQFHLSKGIYVLQVTVGKSTRSFKVAY